MAMRDTLLDVLGNMHFTPKWPPEAKLAVLDLGSRLCIGHEDKWAWWAQEAARSPALQFINLRLASAIVGLSRGR